MEIGLLWFDDDPSRELEDKVGRAAQRYRQKYGRWPNTCYVHPQVVADHLVQELRVEGSARSRRRTIRIVSAQNILLHHYWLGENTKRMSAKQRRAAA
jgi:hypothetical protein